jgi:hypothetical protein
MRTGIQQKRGFLETCNALPAYRHECIAFSASPHEKIVFESFSKCLDEHMAQNASLQNHQPIKVSRQLTDDANLPYGTVVHAVIVEVSAGAAAPALFLLHGYLPFQSMSSLQNKPAKH